MKKYIIIAEYVGDLPKGVKPLVLKDRNSGLLTRAYSTDSKEEAGTYAAELSHAHPNYSYTVCEKIETFKKDS